MAEPDTQTDQVSAGHPPTVWILAVDCDKVALAAATLIGLVVMLINTYLLGLHDGLLIIFRALVAFVAVWCCVFILLMLLRRHVLRQIERESAEDKTYREEEPVEVPRDEHQEVA